MGTDSRADDRIDLPPDFADHLATVSNLETPPETVAEYWSTFADQLAASDQTIEPEDLYTDDPTRHEVRVNDRIRYSPCILDALGAAVMEAQTPVTVRSVDPVTKTPILFTVDDGTVDVIIQTQRELLDSAVKGMGNPDTVFRISSVTVAVNVILGVVGVHAMGASGVIAATIIAELLRCLLLHRALRQNDTVVPLLPDPLRAQFRSAAGMAVVMAGLTHVLPNTLKFQMVAGTLGIVTYVTLYLPQDDLARRSVVDFGLAVSRFLTDEELYNQTAN